MSTTVTYKGSTLTTAENQTRTLKTSGKYMEDDITIVDVTSGGGGGSITQDQDGYLVLSPDGGGSSITVDPLSVTQNGTYTAQTGHAYSPVTVNVAGGGSGGKQINFIDYDGTLLHSYTKAEINAMTSDSDLPANPTHTGLTAQGWNWTLAQIKAQLTAMPDGDVNVGQMYITASGDTEIDVSFPDSARLSPILTICVSGTVTVDWGDNTTPDTVTGSSLATKLEVPHTYSSTGDYMMKIHVVSGEFRFYCSSSYTLLRKNTTGNENRVYSNCVQAVRFGRGVTSIGGSAFYGCYSLASITIPSGVTSIGGSAFFNCYSLASVTIPSEVTSIGVSAFDCCYSLASITIPSGVTSIGGSAFDYCYSLASITIPSGVTSIGTYAFYYCDSLASVTIPSGVTSIGAYTFTYCHSLASITIPSEVTSIGNYAFAYCYSLASITIPSGVTSIGGSAFYGCYSLASITIPSGVTSIGDSAFFNCYSLASITIPSGVTSIGGSAFYGCYSLASITIPSEVTSIGDSAFYGCSSLASVTIPSEVTSIGGSAFSKCYGVAEYHIERTTPPTLGTTAFNNIVSDCKIYVPSASLTAYQTAENWSAYASYMVGE